MNGVIFDIKKYAIHDGPGIRTSIFLKGCPLRCWWCHNPESLDFEPATLYRKGRCINCSLCENSTKPGKCPTLALDVVGRKISPKDVLDIIKKDEIFYDQSGGGATFTGGEPLAQPEFLYECLKLCRKEKIHTAVDTSGFAPREVVEKIASVADLFLFDIKHIDNLKHEYYTGVGNKQILDNLQLLDSLRLLGEQNGEQFADVHIRIPFIPTVNSDDESISAMADLISKLKIVRDVSLLPYHTAGSVKYPKWGLEYKMEGIKPPTKEEISHASEIFASFGIGVKIGG